jgi:hypothetical protein
LVVKEARVGLVDREATAVQVGMGLLSVVVERADPKVLRVLKVRQVTKVQMEPRRQTSIRG